VQWDEWRAEREEWREERDALLERLTRLGPLERQAAKVPPLETELKELQAEKACERLGGELRASEESVRVSLPSVRVLPPSCGSWSSWRSRDDTLRLRCSRRSHIPRVYMRLNRALCVLSEDEPRCTVGTQESFNWV